ncbi:MAG: hypothetical protein COA38_01275 [Fluviicola sp.]|nr:MAG: hypothetical protein COA38_01275 [Fluviicola sp.]
MRKLICIPLYCILVGTVSAQTISIYSLDENNTSALVNDGGIFFNDPSSGSGYEVPKGSGLKTVYAMSFMYGGVDINGQLKYSGQTYGPLEDQFRGPLTIDGAATADQTGVWDLSSIFPASKQEIDNHILNYATAGYVLPSNLANWPAHGDVSSGFDYYLAPFVDVDQDGTYDPMSGDYPCIRGDRAVYVIMNDNADVHASGGEQLGIEMHYMFYQYASLITDIDNTTFVHGKIINRGTQFIHDFKMSVFLDSDVGNSTDDHFGSDSTRNMMYFYNDQFDETNGPTLGYQDAPPAFGVMSLSDDFEHTGSIIEPASTPIDFWNIMSGRKLNGTPWQDIVNGGETNHMYAGNPNDPSDLNNEIGAAMQAGDRRGIASINGGTIGIGDVREFDLAFIYAKNDSASNLDNVSNLKLAGDNVQSYFDNLVFDNCASPMVGIEEPEFENLTIHPNPSKGEFMLSIGTEFSHAEIEILDLSGRIVLDNVELNASETKIELMQPAGIYLLHLKVDGQETVKRIVVE